MGQILHGSAKTTHAVRNSIIKCKWQGYRVSASRLAESNFRYTQASRFQNI